MVKPIVRYAGLSVCVLGRSARVKPIDHPCAELNGVWVWTSDVVSVAYAVLGDGGFIFETANTRYMPAPEAIILTLGVDRRARPLRE